MWTLIGATLVSSGAVTGGAGGALVRHLHRRPRSGGTRAGRQRHVRPARAVAGTTRPARDGLGRVPDDEREKSGGAPASLPMNCCRSARVMAKPKPKAKAPKPVAAAFPEAPPVPGRIHGLALAPGGRPFPRQSLLTVHLANRARKLHVLPSHSARAAMVLRNGLPFGLWRLRRRSLVQELLRRHRAAAPRAPSPAWE
jgi:hypothetical protein